MKYKVGDRVRFLVILGLSLYWGSAILTGLYLLSQEARGQSQYNVPTAPHFTDQVWFEPLKDQEDGAIGRIVFYNMTMYGGGRVVTTFVETQYGDIRLQITQTRNGDCVPDCPDTIEAVMWPPQMAIRPMSVTVAELGTGYLRVYMYGGS